MKQPRVGTRKLQSMLATSGHRVGRDGLFTMLRRQGMLVKPKKNYKRTTYSGHNYAVAPNRLKSLEPQAPYEVVVSDITYLRLQRGFCYLFLVTDLFSRKVLGAHVSRDLSHHAALVALNEAYTVSEGQLGGALHHSDRGCQYCCHEYLKALGEYGMIPSMTDENHCYQNAVAERVNGILKGEFDLDGRFRSIYHAKQAVAAAVKTYNEERVHWSLGLRTPEQVLRLVA